MLNYNALIIHVSDVKESGDTIATLKSTDALAIKLCADSGMFLPVFVTLSHIDKDTPGNDFDNLDYGYIYRQPSTGLVSLSLDAGDISLDIPADYDGSADITYAH